MKFNSFSAFYMQYPRFVNHHLSLKQESCSEYPSRLIRRSIRLRKSTFICIFSRAMSIDRMRCQSLSVIFYFIYLSIPRAYLPLIFIEFCQVSAYSSLFLLFQTLQIIVQRFMLFTCFLAYSVKNYEIIFKEIRSDPLSLKHIVHSLIILDII